MATSLSQYLRKLIFENKTNVSKLSREIDIPQQTLNRIVHGQTKRPHPKSVEKLSEYFGVSLEKVLNKAVKPTEQVSTHLILQLPVIPWDKITNSQEDPSEYETVPFVGNASGDSFATVMPDYSMEPVFPIDSLLIFDPNHPAKDHSYILVKIHDVEQPIFRQLIINLDHKYLKPLNPNLDNFELTLLRESDTILGCLVESRHSYVNDNLTKG